MNIENDPPADGGRDVVPGDAHEGAHLVPLDADQGKLRPLPLLHSWDVCWLHDHDKTMVLPETKPLLVITLMSSLSSLIQVTVGL